MSVRKPRFPVHIIRRFEDELTKPTLQEKLDYAGRIGKGIEAVQLAILSGDPVMIDNAISALFSMIPTAWYDDQFIKDIKDAVEVYEEYQQPTWCGGVPYGKPVKVLVERKEPFLVLQACISLLERLGMLGRKVRKEVQTGIRIEDVEKAYEELMKEGMEEEPPPDEI